MSEQTDAPLTIDGGVVLTPLDRFSPGRIIVRNGSVEAVGLQSDIRIPTGALCVNAAGLTIAPGFIDPHIHGCGAADVMNGTYEALNVVSRMVARHGTTAFLPTTVSAPADVLGAALERLGGALNEKFAGAEPVGIHLEGPFINIRKRGIHPPDAILGPNAALLAEWIAQGAGWVKLLTLAPEIEGTDALMQVATRGGVHLAMGHSNASYEEARNAVDRGICYAVHTFNAMREFTHRDPGIVGTVLADDRVFAEIICDGIHVDPAVVRIFGRAKPRERVLLVTDATSGAGMPDGEYVLGPDTVHVIGGVCRDREGRLAGSTLTQEIGLRNFVEWTGISLQDALFGVTWNPAQALHLEDRGRIERGSRADLVLLDDNFHVIKTFVAGRLVFDRNSGTDATIQEVRF